MAVRPGDWARGPSAICEGTPALEVLGQALQGAVRGWGAEGPRGCCQPQEDPPKCPSPLSPGTLSACGEWLIKHKAGRHNSVNPVIEPTPALGRGGRVPDRRVGLVEDPTETARVCGTPPHVCLGPITLLCVPGRFIFSNIIHLT